MCDKSRGSAPTARVWSYPSNGGARPDSYHEVYNDAGTTKVTETDLTWRPDGRLASETTSTVVAPEDYSPYGEPTSSGLLGGGSTQPCQAPTPNPPGGPLGVLHWRACP